MRNISKLALVAFLMNAGISFAGESKPLNCEVGGKKIHSKDKSHCEKKKGIFTEIAAPVSAPKADLKAPKVESPKVEAPKVENKLEQKTEVKTEGK